MSAAVPTARDLGLVACHDCGLVCRDLFRRDVACPRCGAHLHRRKRDSIARTWALLVAAMFLYITANVLPIMRTDSLFGGEDRTILSGVVELWRDGSWLVALIVFVASVIVPILKFFAISALLLSLQRGSRWSAAQRARLFRLVEIVGYWSMLDVFVVALLVPLVHFQPLTQVIPRPGLVCFGLVVVLTMLASMSFDPRLIWDTVPAPPRNEPVEEVHD